MADPDTQFVLLREYSRLCDSCSDSQAKLDVAARHVVTELLTLSDVVLDLVREVASCLLPFYPRVPAMHRLKLTTVPPVGQTMFTWASDDDCSDGSVKRLTAVLTHYQLTDAVHRVWISLLAALKCCRRYGGDSDWRASTFQQIDGLPRTSLLSGSPYYVTLRIPVCQGLRHSS